MVLSIIFMAVKIFLWLSNTLIWFDFFSSANSNVTGVVYMFYFSHCCTFMRHCVEVVKINNHFLSYSFFVIFPSHCWNEFFRIFRVGSGGDSRSSANRRVSIVLSFIISVEIFTVPELGCCVVIVGDDWYLKYLLSSFWVVIPLEVF